MESGICEFKGWLQVQNEELLFSVVDVATIQEVLMHLKVYQDEFEGYRALDYEPTYEQWVARIWVDDLFFDVYCIEDDEWCPDGQPRLALNAGQKPGSMKIPDSDNPNHSTGSSSGNTSGEDHNPSLKDNQGESSNSGNSSGSGSSSSGSGTHNPGLRD